MQNESASFWADIKNYEERLTQAPDSLLFARLAEVYLKVGLIDDALHTARQGVVKNPGYIAGQRALAFACQAKGLQDECLEALNKVTTALPEDGEAQKMLGRLLSAKGNKTAAANAFRTALEFNPDDTECRVELNLLERSDFAMPTDVVPDDVVSPVATVFAGDTMDAAFGAFEDETDEAEEIIEDIEILDVDEADLLELDEPESLVASTIAPEAAPHDPLSTSTLAELYLQQGFSEKALEIYQSLLIKDPDNAELKSRVSELEAGMATNVTVVDAGISYSETAFNDMEFDEPPPSAFIAPPEGAVVDTLAIFEGWLDNIGRIKGCR